MIGKWHLGQKGGLVGDVMEEIDWSVGEIMKTLEANGLTKNTPDKPAQALATRAFNMLVDFH